MVDVGYGSGLGPAAIDPEVLVERLNVSLLRLRSAMFGAGDERDADIDSKIVSVLRRTQLIVGLREMYLVAVAGPQGAGKTTLVREIYGLGPEILQGNLGLGERLPVVVREQSSLSLPRTWIRRLAAVRGEGAGSSAPEIVDEFDVDPDRWHAASRGEDSAAIVVGLDVPANFFGIDGSGFLLLPGYEPKSAGDEEWQHVMRDSLASCSSAIIVTDRNRLAGNTYADLMTDLSNVYLDRNHHVVAVTRTEGMTDAEDRESLRTSAADRLGVQSADVVLTGTGGNYASQWREALLNVLRERHVAPAGPTRERQLRNLKNVLGTDAVEVMARARSLIDGGAALGTEYQYESWMEEFRDARNRARTDYEKAVQEILADQRRLALEALDGWLSRNGGWGALVEKLKNWSALRSSEATTAKSKAIVDIWNIQNGLVADIRVARIERVELKVANHAIAADPARPGAAELEAGGGEFEQSALDTRSTAQHQEPADVLQVPEHIRHDLLFILGQQEEPSRDGFPAVLRYLPILALEGMRFAVKQAEVSGTVDMAAGGPDAVSSTLSTIVENRRILLAGLVGIIGLDVASDGDLDIFSGLQTALVQIFVGSTPGSVPAGGLVALSSIAAAGIIAAATAAAVIAVANSEAAKDRGRAYMIIETAKSQAYGQYMNDFDALLDAIEDKLDSRMRAYLHLDAAKSRTLRLQKALAQFRTDRGHVLEAIGATRPLG